MSVEVIYVKEYEKVGDRQIATVKTKHKFLFFTWYKERELVHNGSYWADKNGDIVGFTLDELLDHEIAFDRHYKK